jgi:hypothetical protein
VIFVLLLAACARENASGAAKGSAALGKEFILGYGRSATIAGEKLKLTFTSVVEDSRCPTGAHCIWEGNAKIVVKAVKSGSQPAILELSTNPQFPTSHSYLGYAVELWKLDPHPSVGRTIAAKRYRATLLVTGRESPGSMAAGAGEGRWVKRGIARRRPS